MIDSYNFGKMVVDGVAYKNDLIVCGDKIISDWRRREGHELAVEDISASIQEFNPSVIIVGAGKWGMMKILPDTKTYFENLGIEIIIQKTGRAWKTYNEQLTNERPMGAFHLTC